MLIALVVFLLVIALLAIPVSLSFRISWQQALVHDLRLRWAFGLVRIQIPASETRAPDSEDLKSVRKHRNTDRPSRTKPHHKRRRHHRNNAMAAARLPALRRRLLRLVGDLWRAVQKRGLQLRMRIGLGDPADTGQLWAYVGPVSGVLAAVPNSRIEITPEFDDAVLDFDASGNIRIIPLQLISLVLALLASPAIWQGVVLMTRKT